MSVNRFFPREVESLKINRAALNLQFNSNTLRENKKWYDDVVVATSYIGPQCTPTRASPGNRP